MGSHHPIRKTVSPEPVAIPDKLYFRIGDVARLCQVPAYVLRFWETEFPNLKPNKGGTGQRLYRRKDVEMALRIKGLLYDQGYTIPGARQIVKTETRPREGDPSEPSSTTSAPGVDTVAATAFQGTGLNSLAESPLARAASAAPEVSGDDPGAAIRRNAHLRGLRDDLQALLVELGGATPTAAPALTAPAAAVAVVPVPAMKAVPAAAAPARPRLVLEPRPAKPAQPAPQRMQGDLFSADLPETVE